MKIAVVGATGLVGQEMITILEQRKVPVDELCLFASANSAGKRMLFRGKEHIVQALQADSFLGFDFALFSAGTKVSQRFVPLATKQKCVVIDNSKAFRMESNVSLVVPEINAHLLHEHPVLIANPNCSTIQLVVALQPIYELFGIEQIIISTYQAVSGTGKDAVSELQTQTNAISNKKPVHIQVYPHQIAFNCIPHIDSFLSNGYTTEEMKLVNETKKILNDAQIKIHATAVRVPVFVGHAESVYVKTKHRIDLNLIRTRMKEASGLKVVDNWQDQDYPMQIHTEAIDDVLVGRLRADPEEDRALSMWVVANNLRKGAALNAIQILEAYLTL